MTELLISGLVGWLIQEAGRACVERFGDQAVCALKCIVRDVAQRFTAARRDSQRNR